MKKALFLLSVIALALWFLSGVAMAGRGEAPRARRRGRSASRWRRGRNQPYAIL